VEDQRDPTQTSKQTVWTPEEHMEHFHRLKRRKRYKSFSAYVFDLIQRDIAAAGPVEKSQNAVPKSEQSTKISTYPYPEGHREWHERLETILADEEQRIGIEWNLAWGFNNITGNLTRPHPTAKVKHTPGFKRGKIAS
jgi:hypothetical protein